MREIYTARLERKLLLSSAAECYHFEFAFTGVAPDALKPGQFLSLLAEDPAGKTYTRAYSISSAPYTRPGGEMGFDLCVNRVEGGFFSNLLCDTQEGESVRCHGPHGLFTLRQPPADSLFVAASTGIAPIRGFLQWLFPETGPGLIAGCQHWLLYEAAQAEELFYHTYFERLAALHPCFHYVPVLCPTRDNAPQHSLMEQEIGRASKDMDFRLSHRLDPVPAASISRYAYVCGLSEMVKAARARLAAQGWQKQQVLFERYD